uniref:mannosyl-oligosaccharide glucosidase n=1 Tax=Panagrolaimus davidi TaxID=227884 RepID=A0A914QII3_9BILA
MGRYGFANMIGSVSYWTGYCQVGSPCLPYNQAINYGPLTLYSGIPSRPYYPRGFLWDEGFHNLLMRKFRPELSLDIVASWLDMIDSEGWIPREVVLDSEAHRRAPPLLFEDSTVANPPMFIYLIGKLMEDSAIVSAQKDRLIRIFPRLKLLYTWLKDIQKGPKEGSCQWQGRNGTTDLELNPGTTPSGLDDYPRASHPDSQEYHVDMRCWMAMSSTVMLKLAKLANATDWIPTIQSDQILFNNLTALDQLHWSDSAKGYFDYGLHSYEVAIVGKKQPDGSVKYRREVFSKPEYRFVDDVYGYVNIFPFLLKLLPANSAKLQIILTRLNDTQEMWTPFGLRSVSKRSRYYDAYNTDTAAPYWRGPIWINMNYLALEALQHYSTIDGPLKILAKNLYDSLKLNVVTNLSNQYNSTGFIWEHYDDKTGAGAGTRPFTGWSALVLAIMGDAYN